MSPTHVQHSSLNLQTHPFRYDFFYFTQSPHRREELQGKLPASQAPDAEIEKQKQAYNNFFPFELEAQAGWELTVASLQT